MVSLRRVIEKLNCQLSNIIYKIELYFIGLQFLNKTLFALSKKNYMHSYVMMRSRRLTEVPEQFR